MASNFSFFPTESCAFCFQGAFLSFYGPQFVLDLPTHSPNPPPDIDLRPSLFSPIFLRISFLFRLFLVPLLLPSSFLIIPRPPPFRFPLLPFFRPFLAVYPSFLFCSALSSLPLEVLLFLFSSDGPLLTPLFAANPPRSFGSICLTVILGRLYVPNVPSVSLFFFCFAALSPSLPPRPPLLSLGPYKSFLFSFLVASTNPLVSEIRYVLLFPLIRAQRVFKFFSFFPLFLLLPVLLPL